MNKNTIIISIVSVLGTFLLLFGVYKLVNQPIQTDFPQTKELKADDHIKWSPDKKNFLVEYSDFQCPACKNFHDFLNSMEKEASDKATLVFRHFPLYQIHPSSLDAAYAAEAAAKQDKFWEMTDLLFDNQQTWKESNNPQQEYFLSYAKELKLDLERFKKDIDSTGIKNKVDENLKEVEQMGVNSAPTFFLNGKKLDLKSFDELKQMLKNL